MLGVEHWLKNAVPMGEETRLCVVFVWLTNETACETNKRHAGLKCQRIEIITYTFDSRYSPASDPDRKG